VETKNLKIYLFESLRTSFSISNQTMTFVDRERGKANVVGSRDGEARGMLATIIAFLTH